MSSIILLLEKGFERLFTQFKVHRKKYKYLCISLVRMSKSSDSELVSNRSEILFIYDAERANPNGNPMSSDNSPRIDRETGNCIVTDVRLKRYIRDQLRQDDNDETVYIVDKDASTRSTLAERVFPEDVIELLQGDEAEEAGEQIRSYFLENAIDVRFFGALLSFDKKNETNIPDLLKQLPGSYTGPVQFGPAISLNAPVQENEEYDSLTTVIGSKDKSESGGYELPDKRIKYALFPFHGIVNENSADKTNLTDSDVRLLDETIWKSLKEQTITRTKIGQEPRFYLRVEYDGNYQIGDIHNQLEIPDSINQRELRSTADMKVNIDKLVRSLSENETRIQTLHINGGNTLKYEYDGMELEGFSEVMDVLSENVDAELNVIEPYKND